MTNFVTPGPTSTRARNIFRVVDTFAVNANEFHKNYALKNVYSKSESSTNLLKVGSKAFTFHAMVKASPGTHLECDAMTFKANSELILLCASSTYQELRHLLSKDPITVSLVVSQFRFPILANSVDYA